MNDLQATTEAHELIGQPRTKHGLTPRDEVDRHLHEAALPALRQAAGVDVR